MREDKDQECGEGGARIRESERGRMKGEREQFPTTYLCTVGCPLSY